MATFVLEDLSGSAEAMVFPKTMLQVGSQLLDDAIVVVRARLDRREDAPKLVVMELRRPEIFTDSGPPVRLRVRAGGLDEKRVLRLREILATHPGDSPVFVHVVGAEKETVLRLDDEFCCAGTTSLYAELRVEFGADCVS
jgi:DNA polymerase-3 subunit alpha